MYKNCWKSQNELPAKPICFEIFALGDVLDVITCAKFQNEILRGYDSTVGQNFHFPTDFWMAITTVQHYCTACAAICVTDIMLMSKLITW